MKLKNIVKTTSSLLLALMTIVGLSMTRTEEITIQNKSKDYDYIKVYIRADLHDESGNPVSEKVLNELKNDECRGELSEVEHMHDFLAQLSMTVKNGDNEIIRLLRMSWTLSRKMRISIRSAKMNPSSSMWS